MKVVLHEFNGLLKKTDLSINIINRNNVLNLGLYRDVAGCSDTEGKARIAFTAE